MPSLVVFLSKSDLVKEYDLSSVIGVSCGAAPLSQEADAEFKSRLPQVPPLRQGEQVFFCNCTHSDSESSSCAFVGRVPHQE